MKLLLDENLSPRLMGSIADIFPGAAHVEDCGLLSTSDDQVWRFALEHGLAIVTKDSDFSERSVLDGCPPKVIWLRIGNCKTSQAELLLRKGFGEIQAFLRSQEDCCLVLSVVSSPYS